MKYTTALDSRRTRLVALATAALLLPTILTACSTAAPTDDKTRAGGGANGVAACMRDKGYDMQDQSSSASSAQVSVPDGVDAETWKRDLASCVGSGEGFRAGDAKPAEQAPGARQKSLESAKCLRDAGFTDYPDDEAHQAEYQPDDDAAFTEAAKACDEKVFGSGGTSFDDSQTATEEGR